MIILQSMLNHRAFNKTTGCNICNHTSDLAWCIQILDEQSNQELLPKGCCFFDFLRLGFFQVLLWICQQLLMLLYSIVVPLTAVFWTLAQH